MNRVAIVDYGLCNVDSVRRAVEECGAEPFVTDDPLELPRADRIILPGVGAFSQAMANLRERGLDRALADEVLDGGAPFLGLCLGMQLIATTGWEGEQTPGLGWVDGDVRRLVPTEVDRRVPHMGWNEVHPRGDSPLFDGIPAGADFYFVHSYHFDAPDEKTVLATTPYCGDISSVVGRDHIFGVQFHPEKSQRHGLRLLANFLGL